MAVQQVLGAVSFFDTGDDAGKSFNPVTLDMNVQSVISGFESTVSDNRHVLEQFVDFDFSSTLYVPIAVEAVRAGLIRAEVVDRVTDPNDPDAADFERVFIVDRPTNSEAAQAAIFVLGNADDKVVSTGGTGDRFEFVPQGYRGSDDLLLSDQSFGNDVIVDLARRDPEFSKTDDVIFLKGVTSIDEVVMSRTSVGREGNTSLKIQTSIESDGAINDGEITVFKQFDPLVNRFAVEQLEIETLSGDIQVWSLPTVAAIRDGRRIVDTVIESNIGDTGRAILLVTTQVNPNLSLQARRLLKVLHLVALQTLILNLSTGKKAILLIYPPLVLQVISRFLREYYLSKAEERVLLWMQMEKFLLRILGIRFLQNYNREIYL